MMIDIPYCSYTYLKSQRGKGTMKEEKETVQLRQVKLVVENDGVSSSPSYNGQPGSAVIISGSDMTSGNDNPAFVPEEGLNEKEANVSIDVNRIVSN